MNPITLKTDVLNNLPWQARPTDCTAPLWRYQENPIIRRNPIPGVARIFNSAVLPYEGAYIGVFRGEQTNGIPVKRQEWIFNPNKGLEIGGLCHTNGCTVSILTPDNIIGIFDLD